METLHESIFIKAPKEKVWATMLSQETYREWTDPFGAGAGFKGSWEEGSEIRFVGPDPEGGGESGMISRIKESRPYEFISIEHVAILHKGVEDSTSEEAKKWTPSFENYTFTNKNEGTEVTVDVDVANEYQATFEIMWRQALQKLKTLAEK